MFLERKLHMLMIKKRREDGKNVDMTKSRVKKKRRRRIKGGDSREQENRDKE